MGMKFTVTVSGDIAVSGIDATSQLAYSFDAEEALRDNLYEAPRNLVLDDVEVQEAEITVSARASIEDIEVEASDIEDYDCDAALSEALGYNCDVQSASFDITESPTGFDEVESATDHETAIAVYVALARAGLEVS